MKFSPKILDLPSTQKGFSLLEVLISLFIIALTLSGFAQAQTYAFQTISHIHYKILKRYSDYDS